MKNSTQISTHSSELEKALEEALRKETAEKSRSKNPWEEEHWRKILSDEPLPFPTLIDNTARSQYIKCPRLFFYSTIMSLRGRGLGNIHTTAGGAIAAGLETARRAFYEQGLPATEAENIGLQKLYEAYGPGDSMEPARSGDKSLAGTVRAYESYMLEYPLGQDRLKPLRLANGRCGIEFTFAAPIPDTQHPETGDPILYGGRFDMLGVYDDQIFVVDEKSTTALGDRWAGQWDLDSQNTGYCWGARGWGYPVAGAILRGIGMLKTKTTHAEVIQYRPQWQIDRWLNQLIEDVADMIKDWKRGKYRYALDKSACDAYSGCPFKLLDESPTPRQWIETHYEVVQWDPLKKS